MDLNEARKSLEAHLDEDARREYFATLRRWFLFKAPITKYEFDTQVRQFLTTNEQINCHNNFMLALLSKRSTTRIKNTRTTSDKCLFECAEYSDYVQPSSPTLPLEYENRNAASELFMPDSGFMSTRIALVSWEMGLNGAEDSVTEILVHACQVFVKNIITAMISRIKGYKVRDGKFQYGFNLAVPDPFLRNYQNVIDEGQESKVDVLEDEDTFIPKSKPSLEALEQQAAFAYACSKRKNIDHTLNVKLLYRTIRESPHLLGLYEMQSIGLLRLGLQMD